MAANKGTFTVEPKEDLEFSNKTTIDMGSEDSNVKRKRGRPADRLPQILEVVLALANVRAYDAGGRIRSRDGQFVERSNLVDLLRYAMSYGKALIGESEFVEMLLEARIKPELIVNENIKRKLQLLYKNHSFRTDAIQKQTVEKIPASEPSPPPVYAPPTISSTPGRPAFKRKHEDEDLTIQNQDIEVSEPPVKVKAVENPPPFVPKFTSKAAIQWLYPVDPVENERTQSVLDNKQLSGQRQRQRRDIALASRRNIPDNLEDEIEEEESQ